VLDEHALASGDDVGNLRLPRHIAMLISLDHPRDAVNWLATNPRLKATPSAKRVTALFFRRWLLCFLFAFSCIPA
jgi:hypothetical protein